MKIKKKIKKFWLEFITNKRYSKTLEEIENRDKVILIYRNQGVHALISRVGFLSQYLGRTRISGLYLFLSEIIKDENVYDNSLLKQLAVIYYPSEKNKRAFAWSCLKSNRLLECYEQIQSLKNYYKNKPSESVFYEIIDRMENKLLLKIENNSLTTLETLSKKNKVINKVVDFKEDNSPNIKDIKAIQQFIFRAYQGKDIKKLFNTIIYLNESDFYKASLLLQVAKQLRLNSDKEGALYLAKKALDIDTTESISRGAYWIGRHLGDRDFCFTSLSMIKNQVELSPNSITLLRSFEKLNRDYHNTFAELEILNLLKNIEIYENYKGITGKVCYVLHNSFPYSSGGYATRGHGLLLGLKKLGLDIEVVNRPGFPYDIKDDIKTNSLPLEELVDGVSYHLIPEPQRKGITSFNYMSQSVDALIDKFRVMRPSMIMAASNYLTAFPAMIAAKKLGIPFIYEVRGFWEITRLSREPEFANSSRFFNQKRLETEVAENADHVFTLTSAMKAELIERGVTSNISLLPNSCNPEYFEPRDKDLSLLKKLNIPETVPVIGYIGTFVVYEGLDDLATACAELKKEGIEFRLLIVGNENATGLDRGPITQQIYDIAKKNGFSDWLIMPGRIPYEEVEAYYSLIDIAPFPRKPWPVCEMVSPMKPLEALAMEKIVVVSSVHALTEMIIDGETGRVFEKGNNESLAHVLKELLNGDITSLRYGVTGRKWVLENRTWDKTAAIAASKIREL